MKMKKTILFSAVLSGLVAMGGISSCSKAPSASLKSDVDSVSYAIGVDYGTNFKRMIDGAKEQSNIDLNVDDLLAGFITTVKGDSAKMNVQEAAQVMQAFFMKVEQKVAEENKAAGDKFLAEKEKEDGVQKTASGLMYKVVTEGKGAKPTASSTVKVHYKGTHVDGSEFDSSYSRNEPAEFPLSRMIPAWIEGIPMMNVGSKYVFYVPAELGYGEAGHGVIKPNEALVFEVELLDILPDAAAPKK